MAATTTLLLPAIAFILLSIQAYSLPFIVLYGFGDKCSNKGITRFTERLSNWSGSTGYCIEIGDGTWDSLVMPLFEQTSIACEKVKNISELSKGYNIVGLSQGNLVARGIIEFCEGGPSVKNYISLGGPHAGIASVPLCGERKVQAFIFEPLTSMESFMTLFSSSLQSGLLCVLLDDLLKNEVYTKYVQEHCAPSNYFKIPTDISAYIEGCKFLPKLNNEVINMRNSTYKERFESLENLVLIMFANDTVLVPKQTSLFGYYPDGAFHPVLPAQETKLYTEDWIGLKTLDEAGKVQFITVAGNHLQISQSCMEEYIVPYLEEDSVSGTRRKKYILHTWFSSFWNHII